MLSFPEDSLSMVRQWQRIYCKKDQRVFKILEVTTTYIEPGSPWRTDTLNHLTLA